MSRTFTKLFSSITESTVWCEPHGTRLTWITMLAMADHAGRVWGSVPGLAHRARVTLDECELALRTFMSPDAYSRTPDFEGRRIEPIDGGWRLLNYAKYRAVKDEESVKESKRNYINARRAKERGVENVEPSRTLSIQEEVEAEVEEERSKAKAKGRVAPLVLPGWLSEQTWADWHAYRNRGKGWTRKAQELSLRTLTALWAQGQDPARVIEQSIERGWTGLFELKTDTRGNHETRSRLSAAERVRANAVAGETAQRAAESNRRTYLVGSDGGDLWPPLDE